MVWSMVSKAHALQDHNFPPMDEHLEKEHQEKTKVKNIQVWLSASDFQMT